MPTWFLLALLLLIVKSLAFYPLQEDNTFFATQDILRDFTTSHERAAGALDLAAIDKFLTEAQKCRTIPGLSVGIISKGQVVFTKGYGLRDVEKNLPVTEHTIFGIGSATKAMTGALTALLAQQGHLDYRTPVHEILTEFKTMDSFVSARATVVDLMTHRTGLPRHDLLWYWRGRKPGEQPSLPRSTLVKGMRYLQPSHDFRVEWQYNNPMLAMAGFAAGEIYRKVNNSACTIENCWEELLQNGFFNALGMTDSVSSHQQFLQKNATQPVDYAQGYACKSNVMEAVCKSLSDFTKCPGDDEHSLLLDVQIIGPAGSVMSSAADMTKWLSALLTPNENVFLSQKSVNMLFAGIMPVPDTGDIYGLGWFRGMYRGNRVVQHPGGMPGSLTQVYLFPDTKDGFVLLTNHNKANVSNVGIVRYLSDAILGLTPSIDIDTLCKLKQPSSPVPPVFPIVASSNSLSIAANYSHPTYGNVNVYETVVDGKYQYNVVVNEVMSIRLRNTPTGYILQHNSTFIGSESIPIEFDQDIITNQVTRLKMPLEGSVEPIVFVNNKYQSRGYGKNLGFGGDGFAFPIDHSVTPDTKVCDGITNHDLKTIDTLSTINVVVTVFACVLVVIALIMSVILLTRKNRYSQLLN
jgi:CubicO group peptidase (beta-lactamase class C family)